MMKHSKYNQLLPEYVTGSLDEKISLAVKNHLESCKECQEEIALWRSIQKEIHKTNADLKPSPILLESALKQTIQPERQRCSFSWLWQFIQVQIRIIRQEIWTATLLIFIIGFIATLLFQQVVIIEILAPMVAIAGIAFIYGIDNDPAAELTLSTPTPTRQILLARLTLVFGYNLVLAMIASFGLLFFIPGEVWSQMILGWLAPMTFLSALALILSMGIGSNNALLIAYLFWLSRFITNGMLNDSIITQHFKIETALRTYLTLWDQPILLFVLTGVICIWILRLARHSERQLRKST